MIEIPLGGRRGAGLFALIDDGDAEQAEHMWCLSKGGYVVRRAGNRMLRLHREVMGLVPGDPDLDHADGDRTNNRRGNLRPATQCQNQANARKRRTTNGGPTSSRYKGVSWHKGRCRWHARIKKNGRGCHLGFFDNEIAAACTYDLHARRLFGSFARVNFPNAAVSIDR